MRLVELFLGLRLFLWYSRWGCLSGGLWRETLFLRGFCFLGGILLIWCLGRFAGANCF
jgi:hypothetical protein